MTIEDKSPLEEETQDVTQEAVTEAAPEVTEDTGDTGEELAYDDDSDDDETDFDSDDIDTDVCEENEIQLVLLPAKMMILQDISIYRHSV